MTDFRPSHLGENRVPVESRLAEHNPITGTRYRMQDLHHHPARTRSQHDLLVADPDLTGDQRRSCSGRNSGYRLATSIEWIKAERTAGSGGNGFSLSDNANGSVALGSASRISAVTRLAC